MTNLLQMLRNSKQQFGEKAVYEFRVDGQFQPISFNDFYQQVLWLASGYKTLGLKKGEKVFMFADNRLQWMITDFAFQLLGVISIPRGTDTVIEELAYILSHSNAEYMLVEKDKAYTKLLNEKTKYEESLKGQDDAKIDALEKTINSIKLFSIDKIDGIQYSFDDIIELGKQNFESNKQYFDNRIDNEIQPDDVVTIIYTSGTTGEPKGVMLTHKGLLADTKEAAARLLITAPDCFISVLPIWHIFQRTCEYITIYCGSTTYYSTLKYFVKDLQTLRPTMQSFVPRILEGVYEKVYSNISKSFWGKRVVFNSAVGISKAYLNCSNYLRNISPTYHKRNLFALIGAFFATILLFIPYKLSQKVFNPIRKLMGGRMRICVTGGGALSRHIDEFFTAIGVNILDGYGLTEISPIVGVRDPLKNVRGTIGKPLPSLQVKIIDENGNTLKPGQRGEILIKGDMVMKGYYNNPQKTNEVIVDGWFHSGDLGTLTRAGELSVLGRIKDTIVLSSGENVEPGVVEAYLNRSEFINTAVVFGQNKKRLSALISPNMTLLKEYAKNNNISYANDKELVANKDIVEMFRNEIIKYSDQCKPFEKVFDFKVLPKEFVVGEEITQTLKIKRHVIAKTYKKEIAELN